MLLIYWLIKVIIGQYQTYVYNKNEERGFCTAEQKYLTVIPPFLIESESRKTKALIIV